MKNYLRIKKGFLVLMAVLFVFNSIFASAFAASTVQVIPPSSNEPVSKPFVPEDSPKDSGNTVKQDPKNSELPAIPIIPNEWKESMKEEIIQILAKMLKEKYVDADKGELLAQTIVKKLNEHGYDSISDPSIFAATLTEDLKRVSNDLHMSVNYAPNMPITAIVPDEETQKKTQEEERRTHANMNNGFTKVECLDGNIGYIKMDSFIDPQDAKETAVAAMQFVKDTKAIIFDLRENRGGNPDMIALLSSYLFDEKPVHLYDDYRRENNSTIQYWTLSKIDGKRLPNIPVFVLTSKETFSAAESFSYNLKAMKRATIIGEVTAGAAHPTLAMNIKYGFNIFMPIGKSINPITGGDWEGVGVVPDIQTRAEDALTTAHIKALEAVVAAATNNRDKSEAQWDLDSISAKLNPVQLSDKDKKKLVGTYGSKNITFENGDLYFQPEGLPKAKMIPLSKTLFDLSGIDYIRIKAELNSEETVTSIKAVFKQGFEETYPVSIQKYSLKINGSIVKTDTDPIVEKGEVFIPFRTFFEAIGANVKWDEKKKQAVVVKEGLSLSAKPEALYIDVNGKKVNLSSPVISRNGRLYLPEGCIAEIIPSTIDVDKQSNSINFSINPIPEDAYNGIIKAFDTHQVVAIGDVHELKQLMDYITNLISKPEFIKKTKTIVVEFGNAKYQNIVDDYISGKQVTMSELQKVWRNLSVTALGPHDSPSYKQFFDAVRAVNKTLPVSEKLQVYLGDVPIDWESVRSKEEVDKWLLQRDSYFANVVDEKIYKKGVKGLIIEGTAHIIKDTSIKTKLSGDKIQIPTDGNKDLIGPMEKDNNMIKPINGNIDQGALNPMMMIQILEKKYPGTTFSVMVHTGFGSLNNEMESKLKNWSKPAFAKIKGTWLGTLDMGYDSLSNNMIGLDGKPASILTGKKKEDGIDGYLYLGPIESLTASVPSIEIYEDDTYLKELSRRHMIVFGTPIDKTSLINKKPEKYIDYIKSAILKN